MWTCVLGCRQCRFPPKSTCTESLVGLLVTLWKRWLQWVGWGGGFLDPFHTPLSPLWLALLLPLLCFALNKWPVPWPSKPRGHKQAAPLPSASLREHSLPLLCPLLYFYGVFPRLLISLLYEGSALTSSSWLVVFICLINWLVIRLFVGLWLLHGNFRIVKHI